MIQQCFHESPSSVSILNFNKDDNMKKILIFLALVILFGCDEFTSEQRYNDDYYVITGLLFEGQPIQQIFIGKTVSPGELITDFNIYYADVVVKEFEEGVIVDSINLSYLSLGTGYGVYMDSTQSKIISSEYTYRIEARIGDKLVYAETEVPKYIEILADDAFTFEEDTEDYPNLVYETADSEHPIIIQTATGEPINLMFEFYCLEEFGDHPQYIYDFGDHDTPDDEEEYESPGDGSPRRIEFYGSYLPEMNPENEEYYITEQSYSGPFVFYGDYQITIYSISDSYYNYLYKPDGYAHGGIQNGFGYFGAVSGKTIYTEVVE